MAMLGTDAKLVWYSLFGGKIIGGPDSGQVLIMPVSSVPKSAMMYCCQAHV